MKKVRLGLLAAGAVFAVGMAWFGAMAALEKGGGSIGFFALACLALGMAFAFWPHGEDYR